MLVINGSKAMDIWQKIGTCVWERWYFSILGSLAYAYGILRIFLARIKSSHFAEKNKLWALQRIKFGNTVAFASRPKLFYCIFLGLSGCANYEASNYFSCLTTFENMPNWKWFEKCHYMNSEDFYIFSCFRVSICQLLKIVTALQNL